MSIRVITHGFYFLLIVIFFLFTGPFDKILIILALLLSILISYISFLSRWLSLDGMWAAVVIGTVTLGIGGWDFTVYLLVFFMTSNLIAAVLDSPDLDHNLKIAERRYSTQVWANGFWFCLFICIWKITGYDTAKVAAIGAIAAATSDTWATLIGTFPQKKSVILLNSFKKVPAGTDGGVSINGTVSAFLGASLIAMLVLVFDDFDALNLAIAVLVGGFIGCLADSFFGARFQYHKKPFRIFGKSITMTNDTVNLFSTGTGSIISILTFNLLQYALV